MDAYWQIYSNYAAKNIVDKLEQEELSLLNDFLKNMYEYNPKTYILIPAVFPLIDAAARNGKESFKECLAQLDLFMDYCGKNGTYLEKNAARLNTYLRVSSKRKAAMDKIVKDAVNKQNKKVTDFKTWAFEYFGNCCDHWHFDADSARTLFYRAKKAYEKDQENKKSNDETEKIIKDLCERFGIHT